MSMAAVLIEALDGTVVGTTMPRVIARHIVPVFKTIRYVLSASLHDMFVFGAILVAAEVACASFILNLPLRTTNRSRHAPTGGV